MVQHVEVGKRKIFTKKEKQQPARWEGNPDGRRCRKEEEEKCPSDLAGG